MTEPTSVPAPGAETRRASVGPGDAGARLDAWLAAALEGLSRSRIKALIRARAVTVAAGEEAGATVSDPDYRVKPGQSFVVAVPPPAPAAPAGQAIPLDIVFEDDALIVVDKPAGLVVHPAPGNPDRTLVNALIAHCGDTLRGIGGARRPGIVHRLDKDTSGLMVAAKTEAAHAALTAQFAARTVERAYSAVVWGVPVPAAGEIEGNIGRSPRDRKKMAVLRTGGRPALTRYRVVHALGQGRAALLECRLATGRTHQIRVHLASRGHPVVGDPVYGGRRAAPIARQALHARTLGFDHPSTGERLRFERDIPPDMRALLDLLG